MHFILLKNGQDVSAITESDMRVNYDFYDEILLLLTSKVLRKNSLMEDGKLVERKVWFSMKDDRFLENLLKIREN